MSAIQVSIACSICVCSNRLLPSFQGIGAFLYQSR